MKMYVPMEKVQIYLNKNACDKILEFAMAHDKEHYTEKVNRTTMNVIQHTYQIKTQTDTGANCSVTSNKSILHQFQRIKSHIIGGVKEEDEGIKAIGKVYIKWKSRSNQVL